MTSLFIALIWIVTIAGLYLFGNVSFWIFAQIFGMIDSYLQNKYWEKLSKKPKDAFDNKYIVHKEIYHGMAFHRKS